VKCSKLEITKHLNLSAVHLCRT